jgi:hypothetical protein
MKKIKIQINNRWTGEIIFEFESENNTVANTVKEAIKAGKSLRSANLRYADLSYANLRYANLRYADLSSADLSYADLSYADLSSADLSYAKNSELAIAMTRILPEGEIIGWKKCQNNKIVKLLIPKEAKRSHAFGRKCRAEYAVVLEITKGSRQLKTAKSSHDESFVYKVGETVKPAQGFDDNWVDECSSGIHFFITKLEAENYA